MGKPFKTTPLPGDPGITRLPDGKFAPRDVPPAPPLIVRKSSDQGIPMSRLNRENAPADHERPRGAPRTVGEEIPWPDVSATYNDAGKPPFKIVG